MHISIQNFGPIKSADITLADLTIAVGPQATGKSQFWQLLKLYLDAPSINAELRRFNLDWGGQVEAFLQLYLGEGMHSMFQPNTQIFFEQHALFLSQLLKTTASAEKLFYVPAQRVMALRDGLTRPFMDYRIGDPFVIRDFSEKLHGLVQTDFAQKEQLFPQSNRLTSELRDLINQAFFHNFSLRISADNFQKKLVLQHEQIKLPFMAWSAGQREFSPLLLGLYWLMPAGRVSRRKKLEWVVIEEPEMGLHPKAISAFMVAVLELMRRGYRVCISTHSPHVLDVVWGLRTIQTHNGCAEDILAMFELPLTPRTRTMAKSVLAKSYAVHYFSSEGIVHDISQLDPGSEQSEVAGWGGLTEFTGRIGDIVAEVVSRSRGF